MDLAKISQIFDLLQTLNELFIQNKQQVRNWENDVELILSQITKFHEENIPPINSLPHGSSWNQLQDGQNYSGLTPDEPKSIS